MRFIIAITMLIYSGIIFAEPKEALLPPPPGFDPKKMNCTEIQNMPRVRAQGSFDLCFAYTAATIAQWYFCKTHNISPCSSVDMKHEISPLSVAGWAHRTDPNKNDELQNHENIEFGGSPLTTLGLFSAEAITMAESCYPFDRVASKYTAVNYSQSIQLNDSLKKILSNMESLFKQYKDTGSTCNNCIVESFKNDLLFDVKPEDLRLALKKQTFGAFLHEVTIASCEDVIEVYRPLSPIMNYYPDLNKTPVPDVTLKVIKSAIQSGYPVAMGGMCTRTENGECDNHSAVISGYCSVNMPDGTKSEVVKIHNSWGMDWQRTHHDGWVDANALVNHQNSAGSIVWWTIPKKK